MVCPVGLGDAVVRDGATWRIPIGTRGEDVNPPGAVPLGTFGNETLVWSGNETTVCRVLTRKLWTVLTCMKLRPYFENCPYAPISSEHSLRTYLHIGRDWVGARSAGIMDAVDKAVPGGELRLTTTIFGWCVPSESLTPEGKSSEREAPDREREFLVTFGGAKGGGWVSRET